jgi:hypothetical protein
MKFLKIIGFAFLANFFLLTGLCVTYSKAQPPFIPPGNQLPQTQQNGVCRKDPSIMFTEEQTTELENLQRSFFVEVKALWGELRDLRHEMRNAVSDSEIQPQVLFEKQMKISAIQAKLENLRFAYMIKARAIFTREQLERFPADCPLQMELGYWYKKGHGKGISKRNPPIGR